MKNIKVLLVDEELIFADHISNILSHKGFQIVAVVHSIDEAILSIKCLHLDFIFVNLLSKKELIGIQQAQRLNQFKDIPVVFITNVIHRNPVSTAQSDHLIDTEYGDESFGLIKVHEAQGNPLTSKKEIQERRECIYVKNDYIYEKIFIDDILWVEANGAYSKLNTIKKQILLSINLTTFQKYVKDEKIVRVHRSYLVNIDQIEAFEANFLHVYSELIPVGAKYKDELAQTFPYISKTGIII